MSFLYLPSRVAQFEQSALVPLEQRHNLSRLLLGALMDHETRAGESNLLDRKGPSGRGDGGHGHGVWQIDDRSHGAFLQERMPDGRFKWEDPFEAGDYAMKNILLPAIREFKGDVFLGLAAWNCGAGNVREAMAKCPAHSPLAVLHRAADTRTANGDFAQDVLFRMVCFATGRDPYP